ncbi:hypothetical protein ACTXPA_17630 [Glutamicibacter arilaitensis]|uniref:hypothetical protein n=1 Tax=Glutamicibacter arilaitensis TaxID=256701 RepID=UPI003FD55EE2
MATVNEAVNETFQGGLLHALNPWAVPDWVFIGIVAIAVIEFIVTTETLEDMIETWKGEEHAERAQRLERMKEDSESKES